MRKGTQSNVPKPAEKPFRMSLTNLGPPPARYRTENHPTHRSPEAPACGIVSNNLPSAASASREVQLCSTPPTSTFAQAPPWRRLCALGGGTIYSALRSRNLRSRISIHTRSPENRGSFLWFARANRPHQPPAPTARSNRPRQPRRRLLSNL